VLFFLRWRANLKNASNDSLPFWNQNRHAHFDVKRQKRLKNINLCVKTNSFPWWWDTLLKFKFKYCTSGFFYRIIRSCPQAFFVRFDKISIWPKFRKLDFWLKLFKKQQISPKTEIIPWTSLKFWFLGILAQCSQWNCTPKAWSCQKFQTHNFNSAICMLKGTSVCFKIFPRDLNMKQTDLPLE